MMFTNEIEGGTGRPSAGRRDRARTAILLAALELTREKGPDFSLREVARRTGYSPAALYRYFDGRDGLIAALALEADRRAAERLRDVSPDLPPADRLIRLGLAYVAFAHYDPAHFSLLLSGSGRPTGDVYEVFLDAARSGVDSGALRTSRGQGPEAIAYAVWSLAHGMAVLARTYAAIAGLDVDAAQREATMLFVGTFASNP